MNDSMNKIAAIRDLLKHYKDVVSKLHFKSHLIDEELQKKKLREDVNDLLEKIKVANQILEMECGTAVNCVDESLQANDDSNESSLDVDEQAKVYSYRHLQQEVITYWNSAYEMLNSLFALKGEVNKSLKRTGNYDLCIKTSGWIMISQLCKLLSTFNTLCDIAKRESVGLSIIPLMKATVTAACAKNASDHESLTILKAKILSNLDRRFPLNDFVMTATLLDPASKNKKYVNLSMDEKSNLLLNVAENINVNDTVTEGEAARRVNNLNNDSQSQSTSSSELSSGSSTSTKRLRLIDTFEEELDYNGEMHASVSQYFSATEKPSNDERANPCLYRRNYKYKHLAELARIYFTPSASSVPVESMFFVTGLLMNGRRSSMSPHKLDKMTFIHDNYLKFN